MRTPAEREAPDRGRLPLGAAVLPGAVVTGVVFAVTHSAWRAVLVGVVAAAAVWLVTARRWR